ncbi:MAG: hypothetical protein HW380_524 [Magnetococcales bacterium]|nr:hypothetical protein [Magnetococcales bacterium]HIJ84955.1 hypothetical protein [Magnetococcales bacterium]
MSDEEEKAKKILAIILRADGSLRYDRMTREQLENLLDQEVLEDSGMGEVVDLAEQGTFHPLLGALGSIGPDFFPRSTQAISRTLKTPAIENSRFGVPLARALQQTLFDLENRLPSVIQARRLVNDDEGNAKLLQDIMDLETSCLCEHGDENDREQCRARFWKLWEFAWARRIFDPDDTVIEILEKLYDDNLFLENRSGGRRTLSPPGGMRDPRMEDG